ncbi:diacylglycerol O-acyltransferase 3 [Elaeis guineensis]|uniref:Diacylglycerol O-acyltransferase 3 n=1 Tax=Elaeis guineensis var. tenera TaxID=51953 RepID=A0A6I9QTH1_ELAGV|nr:diacylglycerol O-acyltransferase 3 [Elaeis guineensis]
MEISGAALRRVPAVSSAGFQRDAGEPSFSGFSIAAGCGRFGVKISSWPRRVRGGCGFSDEGYLRYYATPARCGGGRKKEEKRRARLVESLARDLSAFYSVGFGVEAGQAVVGDVKAKMITEAAEVLLAQLNQLRAGEKDMERKRKEEKKEMKRKRKEEKAAMKAARLKDSADLDASSTSSESSNSDGETVVKMSSLRTTSLPHPRLKSLEVRKEAPKCNEDPITLELGTEERMEENRTLLKPDQECSSSSSTDVSCKCSEIVVEEPADRIEVCVGGKCKRSGSLELLNELQRKAGIEGVVVGCKCMGKCRDGPNVRVSDHCVDSVKPPGNPLFIGVGLEDVGTILAEFFGEKKDVGLVAA